MFAGNDSAHDTAPICDNRVVALVARARDGDERAWAALVDQYAPLIWALCRRYRLDTTDTADVGQNVWLLLVNQLGEIRDPAALTGWLATHLASFLGGLIGNGAYRNQDEAAESSGYSPTRSACADAGSAGWRMSSAASGRHDRDVAAGEGDDRRGRRRLTRTEEL